MKKALPILLIAATLGSTGCEIRTEERSDFDKKYSFSGEIEGETIYSNRFGNQHTLKIFKLDGNSIKYTNDILPSEMDDFIFTAEDARAKNNQGEITDCFVSAKIKEEREGNPFAQKLRPYKVIGQEQQADYRAYLEKILNHKRKIQI